MMAFARVALKCSLLLPAHLLSIVGIVRGQSVLDIAGGPGEPSLTIAETVGPTGSVICTDAAARMVEAAESEARRRGITNVTFRQCAADSLPFGNDSFVVVVRAQVIIVSRLGVGA